MPDIFFIQPPIRDFYLTRKRTFPYGLLLMASLLEQHGFSVGLFDGLATAKTRILPWPAEMAYLQPYFGKADLTPFALFHHYQHFGYSFETIAAAAQASAAAIIGISSLFTPYHAEALKVAETVKKACPQAIIVMGGHHPTAMPEAVLSCPAVDFIIRGEGEIALLKLAQALRDGGALTTIPGVGFRQAEGGFYLNPPAAAPTLDDLPRPAYHLLKSSFYQRRKRQGIALVAARGCPLTCSYCCLGASGPPYRARSVAAVLSEIEFAVDRYDVGFIDFEDEHLTLNKNWFMSLLNEFTRRFGNRNIELRAMNGLFPPSLDKDIIQAMQQAGFRTLNLSVGALNPQQLARFHRPDMKAAVARAMALSAAVQLEIVAYLVVGAPEQSAAQSLEDMLWLAEREALVGVSVFYPAPGSADFATCQRQGCLPPALALFRSSVIPLSATTTRTEAVTLLRLGRILNFIKLLRHHRPTPSDQRLEIGVQALSHLYKTGEILGHNPENGFYPHLISQPLVDAFRKSGLGQSDETLFV